MFHLVTWTRTPTTVSRPDYLEHFLVHTPLEITSGGTGSVRDSAESDGDRAGHLEWAVRLVLGQCLDDVIDLPWYERHKEGRRRRQSPHAGARA